MQEEKYKNEVPIQVIAERINTMQNDVRDLKVMGNNPELTRAMVVGIGFSYKRKKK